METGSASIEDSLIDEARRLLAEADRRDVPMRLLGGMAVRLLLGDRIDERFHRQIDDLDFITTRKASREVERLLEHAGWEPESRFNTLHGHRRLLFHEPAGERKVDVFVERFEMCHTLPLAERIGARPQTLPAAELLMSKLQIVQLNAKDMGDLYALLDALEVASHDQDAINADRIAQLTGADWGLHHTFELNLQRLLEQIGSTGLDDQAQARVAQRIQALQQAMENVQKSRAWRMRARIGERKRWYEEPEEAQR
ncbi:MAG: nucleotidyltransferase family protein [Solirubrobacteraceae bacterium]